MTPEETEYRTVRVTPASATKRKRHQRRRSTELAQLEADGWQIVEIEPERFLRPGDKVTVKRAAAPDNIRIERQSLWTSLDPKGKAALLLGALAVVVLILGVVDSML